MSHECTHCGLPPTKKPRIPIQSPFETHLGTTIAFTAHVNVRVDILNLVADANADIVDLDRNIEKIETALAAAKKERDETIAFRDAHLALFPPIHQLPAEVLLEIFHLTFEKPYNVFASSRSGPWLLGKVCRGWRQVAWSCPSLWTSFTLKDGCYHKVGTKVLFEGALSRSVKCNEFHIPLGGLEETQISEIAKSAESWHDASFKGSIQNFEPFLKIGKMPSLVALGLDIRAVPYDNLDAYYRLLSSLGTKHVPLLRRLTLAFTRASTVIDIEPCKIKFPWTQLAELVVPLDYVASCQQLLTCCPDLETLKDHPHLLRYERTKETPGLRAVVSHSKLSFIDMSSSFAITLLDHIRCPAVMRLSLPCARANQSDGEVLQRFIQRSECTITSAELTFDDREKYLVSPEASLSALSGIIDLRLSFCARHPEGRFIDCLSDLTVVPNLRVLTITTTTISRSIWEAELKDTLIRVLSARYQSPEEASTGTNLQEVVVVLGRETYMLPGSRTDGSVYYMEGYSSGPRWRRESEEYKRLLHEDLGKDCTIEDLVDADFVEFRELKERGLNLHLSGSYFDSICLGVTSIEDTYLYDYPNSRIAESTVLIETP